MNVLCLQGSGGKEEKKGAGSSLQEVKRRGRMERSREEAGEEEDMSERLKMLVRRRRL